jgi:hypothetical protein
MSETAARVLADADLAAFKVSAIGSRSGFTWAIPIEALGPK